jgi:hypothetical protein
MLFALGTGPASAELWQIQPSVNLQLGYDDNPQTSSESAKGSFVTSLSGALSAIRSAEASDLAFSVGVASNVYSDAADLDNTTGYLGLDLGHRLERHQFRLGLQYLTQSTLYAQQPPSRLSQVNQQQKTLTVRPSWGYLLNERMTLNLGATLQDVTFEDAGSVSANDYRLGTVDLGVGYALTERFALTGSLGYDHYETQGITDEYDNVRFLAGARYRLSEISDLAAEAGIRSTEQTVQDTVDGRTRTEQSSGPSFNLTYSRQFEAGGGFTLGARRDLTPSSGTEVVDSTGIVASLSLPLRPQWQFGITANAFRNRTPSGESEGGDETAFSIGPSLSYKIARSWGISLGYLFRSQDLGGGGEDAVSNAVYLNLSWASPRNL